MTVDPSALRILHYPDPALRRRAQPIAQLTDEVRRVAERMIELMREARGIGLAAPQVGLPWRMFVADVPPPAADEPPTSDGPPIATDGPVVYVNPTLTEPAGEIEIRDEGCLSMPEVHGEVLRPASITIEATGLDGGPIRERASGLLARCWQHECDHLDGVLIIDRMTQVSRLRNRSQVRQLERDAG